VKALILNSGRGERLRPLTKAIPKALVKIGEKPLLGHQLDSLIRYDILDVIITTGPFENKLKRYIERKYSQIKVTYVKNPKYRTTNYIYSMWLTKDFIDDNIILLHGDLFFDGKLLRKLIEKESSNCVLVNRKRKPPKKDFKALIRNNRIIKIGVGLSGKNVFFLAPLYKFSRSDFLFWLNEIGKAIKERENWRIYAEDIFNKISDKIKLCPVYFTDDVCLEIDTFKDLETARRYLKALTSKEK